VISIQGLLHVYSRHVGGGIAFEDALDGQRDGLLSWLRYHYQKIQWTERGRVEKLLIKGNCNFIGRTDWDKAHVLAVNPDANYFYGGELLRPPFFTAKWDIAKAQRHTIFCTAAHSPLKGFHWLLYAVILLRREFSDIKVRVAGALWNEKMGFGYYGRFIKRLIDKYDLSHQIIPLPSLSAEEVAKELCKAHAFVIPSLIENSPNSLAEAMLVGTPCVAAYVGGIPTMSVHNVSSLLFPSGDAACLAYYVRRIFTDDFLAQQLSGNAKKVASDRHNAEKINARQLEIYRQITSGAHGRLQ
jgi:glycosyltransferase involved in cell wall biosynthesis